MQEILKLGTRPSPLALRQASEIQNLSRRDNPPRYNIGRMEAWSGFRSARSGYRNPRALARGASFSPLKFEVSVIRTQGDKDKITPLDEVSSPDFFTREIDQALLAGEIDLAVHSSKDLPDILAKGLTLVFETPSISPYDALVSKDKLKLTQLPQGTRIGLSSQRRKGQIKSLRPDLEIVDIRGNIEERMALIEKGRVDAIIVALAALLRLGLQSETSEIFSLENFTTHPKQGRLSLLAKEQRCVELKFILLAQARAIGS
ncbi:MAG: hydroxymethylbilane synthase [Candidatus Omnitrophota bacterium]|nr:hydroxymethylbilane synthase [Candidatus Omnitrophota bacterium]